MPKRFRAGEYLELIESYIGNKTFVTEDDGVITELTVLDLSNMVMYIHQLEKNCAEQAKALALAEIQHRALEDAAETAMRLATQIRVATRAVHFPESIVPTVWSPPMTPGESCPSLRCRALVQLADLVCLWSQLRRRQTRMSMSPTVRMTVPKTKNHRLMRRTTRSYLQSPVHAQRVSCKCCTLKPSSVRCKSMVGAVRACLQYKTGSERVKIGKFHVHPSTFLI